MDAATFPDGRSLKPHVLVLMATYNGERYLAEQIDSILDQKDVDVSLLITDDCSKDGSYEIAQEHAQADSRIISKQNQNNAGTGMNFLNMLYDVDSANCDYVAFSDQDDVWLNDKLTTACTAIVEKENDPDARRVEPFGIPVLYCSELQNVDQNLNNPKLELEALNIKQDKRATPLMRNYYSGCTMVMNKAMVRLFQSARLGNVYRLHDTWSALVGRYCANFIIDVENARILRRITGVNTCGAITPGMDIANASVARLSNSPERRMSKTAAQLYECFGQYMSCDDAEMIRSFSLVNESLASRIRWALRDDYRGTTISETLLMKAKILFGRY